MATAGNWIWRDNLNSLIAELERISGDELDDGVRKVMLDDIKASDADASRWAIQHFDGRHLIEARFASDPGAHVIVVSIDAQEPVLQEVRVLLHIMNSYHLSGGPGVR